MTVSISIQYAAREQPEDLLALLGLAVGEDADLRGLRCGSCGYCLPVFVSRTKSALDLTTNHLRQKIESSLLVLRFVGVTESVGRNGRRRRASRARPARDAPAARDRPDGARSRAARDGRGRLRGGQRAACRASRCRPSTRRSSCSRTSASCAGSPRSRAAVVYDPRTDDHHHLVCRRCGTIEDVDAEVDHTPLLMAARQAGFAAVDTQVVVRGLCSRLRRLTRRAGRPTRRTAPRRSSSQRAKVALEALERARPGAVVGEVLFALLRHRPHLRAA